MKIRSRTGEVLDVTTTYSAERAPGVRDLLVVLPDGRTIDREEWRAAGWRLAAPVNEAEATLLRSHGFAG